MEWKKDHKFTGYAIISDQQWGLYSGGSRAPRLTLLIDGESYKIKTTHKSFVEMLKAMVNGRVYGEWRMIGNGRREKDLAFEGDR